MFFKRNKAGDGNAFLIVGLGNPGREYSATRHNCGFNAVECLASQLSGLSEFKLKHKAMTAQCRLNLDQRLILACPTTYMNASGESVRELLDYYKLPHTRLMVIYDDIDLPLGALRVRASGGPGTHNGMRSIVSCIGEDFSRIRIGIGKPPVQMQLVDFVLGKFTRDEIPVMQNAYKRAAECALEFVSSGIEKAMAKYNVNVKE